MAAELTQERLKARLVYEPGTGLFRWREPGKHNRYRAGDIAGSLHKATGYWRIWIDGVEYLGHRLAWLYMTGAWPAGDLDHRNTKRDENWWDNIREATVVQNRANCPAKITNHLKVKGISFKPHLKKNPYRAEIEIDGRARHLGYFPTAEAAGVAYAAEAVKIYGEFAYKA